MTKVNLVRPGHESLRLNGVSSEKNLPIKDEIGRHSLRFIVDDPELIRAFSNRVRKQESRMNDLLLSVIQQQLHSWNSSRGQEKNCFKLMLVSSLKGRTRIDKDAGAALSGIAFITGGLNEKNLDNLIDWFRDSRRDMLSKRSDVKFYRWVNLYCGSTRVLPFQVRRKIWGKVLSSIKLTSYVSNLGVAWPEIVNGKPTQNSALLGAGDFTITDIHSSPSIGDNIDLGMTVRTHNNRMYFNFVCDRYRFRRHEAKALIEHIERGFHNSV